MKSQSVSLASAIILSAVAEGHYYGFEIMEATGLPSGTIYPALRRLEAAKLIRSDFDSAEALESGGPPRKCFRVTTEGRRTLQAASKRFPMLASQRD